MSRAPEPPPSPWHALVGKPVANIETPALVIDLDAMGRNLTRMSRFAQTHGIRWRAHAKMHKSSALAKLQMEAGAVGVCVQKTSEAIAMAAGGISDILISNEVIDPAKLRRVAYLARLLAARQGRMGVVVDHVIGVERLAAACAEAEARIDVYVEIDVGQGRCGVAPGEPVLALAQAVARHAPTLRFAGLQAYHGRAQHLRSVAERREAIALTVQAASYSRHLIQEAGIDPGIVTGAGTGTFVLEAASGVFGEIQPGSFLFMDADYQRNEPDAAAPAFENALFVKTQVISTRDGYVVCDAGHKSHAIDSGLPLVRGGQLEYAQPSDEHGILRGNTPLPKLGDAVWLIPGHCDPTVNLHDVLIGVRGGLDAGTVEHVIRVDARGALT